MMPGFYYFVPAAKSDFVKAERLDVARLRNWRLADQFADALRVPQESIVAETKRGFGDAPGCVLSIVPASGEIPDRLGFDADRQAWRGIPASTAAIGYDTQQPPRPSDLERRELVAGYAVADAYDQRWQLPLVRDADRPLGELPRAWGFDPATLEPRIDVDPRFRDLWQRSAAVWDVIDKSIDREQTGALQLPSDPDTDAMLFRWVVDCLTVNYRVTALELAVLDTITPGYLSPETATSALNATVGYFAYRRLLAAQKKTVDRCSPPTANSTPGSPDDGRGTRPVAANSPPPP